MRALALSLLSTSLLALSVVGAAAAPTPISVYGAWHCGSDACQWGAVRTMTEFDQKNHWLIDRGDGMPSVWSSFRLLSTRTVPFMLRIRPATTPRHA